MKNVAFTNNTKKTIHVGSKSIRPNETREVDPTMIEAKHKKMVHGSFEEDERTTQPEINPLFEILDGKIPFVLTSIAEKDENGEFKYSDEDLKLLAEAEAEGNGSTRKGVMEGLAEEILSRATQTQEAAELVKELFESSDEDLTAALDLYAGDDGKIALVQGEIDKRAGK